MNAWLTIVSNGVTVFEVEHCGTGDWGWNRTDSDFTTHYANDAELFASALIVVNAHPDTEIFGVLANRFTEWRIG
jgi:hypothetical protein